MAAQNEEPEERKKRKIGDGKLTRRKLLFDHIVEVRSMEEGFLGSWHVGKVTGIKLGCRLVEYQDILSDNEKGYLTEWVAVSPVIDGILIKNQGEHNDYRGNIRPLPPPVNSQKWSFHYGQCVDVCFQDAWWEGVIFDHEDGSDDRKVFFPDMGDEMKAQIEKLRITQVWDEVTEEWKPRGTWLFLELVEELEQEWPLIVSLRQIWYELRVKKGFQNLREWTSSSRDIWKDLLLQVLCNNLKLTVKHFFHELNFSADLLQEGHSLQFSDSVADAVLKPEAFFGDRLAIVPYETDSQLDNLAVLPSSFNGRGFSPVEGPKDAHGLASIIKQNASPYRNNLTTTMQGFEGATCDSPPSLSIITPNQVDIFSEERVTTNLENLNGRQRHRLQWLPAGQDMLPGAEYCPNVIAAYKGMEKSGQNHKGQRALIPNVRQHLAYIGWKIEYVRDGRSTRMRYTSPSDDVYYSLRNACRALSSSQSLQGNERNNDQVLSSSQSPQGNERNNVGATDNLTSFSLTEKPQSFMGEFELFSGCEYSTDESDLCPEAVLNYFLLGQEIKQIRNEKVSDIALKAKKHLSATGWSFHYRLRKGKKEKFYISPTGKAFYSLRTACGWILTKRGLSGSDVFISDAGNTNLHAVMHQKQLTVSSFDALQLKEYIQVDEVKVRGSSRLQRKRKQSLQQHSSALLQTSTQDDQSPMLQDIKGCQALNNQIDDSNAEYSTRVLRLNKRARQIGCSSTHQTPRTILSWLIDANVVLPRAKVQYCGKKDGRPKKEGRITREGIKCICCQKVFTLSKFEAHAGSKCHRPSENIFLEDGRSLMDCQLQLKRENNVRNTRSEPHGIKDNRYHANDYICSVCHDGGELVLCDRCPSSFHTSCVGLKEVPDGDWFCPSCCCSICGLSRFNENREHLTGDSVVNCGQCERQYHVRCLRNKGFLGLDNYPEENWFCNKGCERIYLGLQELLGKPIPVGLDNLTWTLLKYTKAEGSSHGGTDNKHLVESYSKLNVALSVMHECFEPVKEHRTRRDLVEDVIFSRWSDLNRLNFQGFYTVLLERDDELITVATVRVYGEKVAEMPLIGTRFQYRRLGMCRILMDELEKKLMELGVERLVLPAVPSVLDTWTKSFGFSMMQESERLNFLDYTFLDFQGTVMCQKLLKNTSSTELTLPTEIQQNLCNQIKRIDVVDLEGNSAISEVFQAVRMEESEIVDQGSRGGIGATGGNATPDIENEIIPEYPFGVVNYKESQEKINGVIKCYKRRRISTCIT